jgi:hypothetical protein
MLPNRVVPERSIPEHAANPDPLLQAFVGFHFVVLGE